jgi:hypothetical protein
MKFQLVVKNTREVVIVTDRKAFGLDEAKSYYVRMKQLKEEEFDKIYEVEEYKQPKGMPPRTNEHTERNWSEYKWWKEESTKMDIEKE